ncbi:MAG: glycosyltransferase [Cyanobacteria bacterium P01_A01_bin.45]
MNFLSQNSLSKVPIGNLKIPRLSANDRGNIFFSLVIPTYKERDNIGKLIEILSSLLDENIPGKYELIVVDDDSPDQTWAFAESLVSKYPQLRVMRRQQEKGLSSAVIRGWQIARGEVLGVIDGDLQHPPQMLWEMLQKMRGGKADLTVASRHVEGGGVSSWSVVRRFLSRGAQLLGLILLPRVIGRVSDPMSGYFMVRRECIAEIILNPVGYKILLEVIARGEINHIAEVGYVFCERQQGKSKVTSKHYLDYIHHLIKLRFATKSMKPSQRSFSFPLRRFISFGLVGLSGVFVDMTILYLLNDSSTLSLPLTISKIIAAFFAILNNFLWNDIWTFRDISGQQKGWSQRLKRFLKFNVICLAGLVINVFVLNILVKFVVNNAYIANLIAIAFTTIWNFWINLKLSWRVTDVD